MKVWYKKQGDSKPTMATHGKETRPGEHFFGADPIASKLIPLCKIVWAGKMPTLKLPTQVEIKAAEKKHKARDEKERNQLNPWERATLALRHEFAGTATKQEIKILNGLQTRFDDYGN